MARHRDIRNLDLEEVLREDDYEFSELPELTSEQEEQMRAGVAAVYSALGADCGFDETIIEETLWYYYFDVSQTVDYLLNDVLPSKKTVPAKPKKNKFWVIDSQKNSSNSSVSLASLASTSYNSNKSSTPLISPDTSLQLSSENLVDNKKTPVISSIPSLASLVASSSNNTPKLSNLSTQSSAPKNLSSLTNIPFSTSLSSILNSNNSLSYASPPAHNASSNFSSVTLSMLANLSSSSSLSSKTEIPKLSQISSDKSLFASASSSQNFSLNSEQSKLDALFSQHENNSDLPLEKQSLSVKKYENPIHPLLASPSPLANFLFENDAPKSQHLFNSFDFDLISLVLESVAQSSIKPSRFDKPSPDDIVMNAQKQAGKNKPKVASNPSTLSKPVDQMALDMAGLNLNSMIKTEATISPKPVNSPKSPSVKKVDVLSEYKTRNADQTNLNLVVVGHVDAGKSTMMGHLLYQAGVVDSRTMKKYEKHSEKIGKKSFAFAWVLDETSEERERGITVDVATTQLTTERHTITILDAPGHRDFVPNMISGASQADVAILVVDSTPGEFETGFARGGQTKEHALLIRSLGVRQIAVAVNKLDTCNWDHDRFTAIQNELGDFLTQAGFPPSCVTFVPVSGLQGDNLTSPISDSDHLLKHWYSGPSLLQVIDGFVPQKRAIELPLRLPIADFFRGGIGSTGGVSVSGRILQGHLQVGDNVAVQPGDAIGTVKAIEANDQTAVWAVAGDAVVITLSNLDVVELRPGSVLSAPTEPAQISNRFLAQVLIFEPPVPITPGYPVILHHQSLNISAYITKLVNLLDRTTGSIQKTNPRHLPKSCTATLEITADTLICLESFKSCKDLGRFALRREGSTLATGIILQVLPSTL